MKDKRRIVKQLNSKTNNYRYFIQQFCCVDSGNIDSNRTVEQIIKDRKQTWLGLDSDGKCTFLYDSVKYYNTLEEAEELLDRIARKEIDLYNSLFWEDIEYIEK
jgi:hypothetical protein